MFTSGNVLTNVEVPVTGFAAVNSSATVPPTLEELQNTTGLPSGYTYLGLLADGGGYSEEVNTGDVLNTWIPDWRVQWGEYGISGKIIAAENNSIVRLLQGDDSNVRKETHQIGTVGLITGEIRANGKALLRGGMANFTSITPSFGKQGSVNTIELGFEWEWNTTINGYYRYAAPTFTCTPTKPGTNNVYTKTCPSCNTQPGTNNVYTKTCPSCNTQPGTNNVYTKTCPSCNTQPGTGYEYITATTLHPLNGATLGATGTYYNLPRATSTTVANCPRVETDTIRLVPGDIIEIEYYTDRTNAIPYQFINGSAYAISSYAIVDNKVTATYAYTGGAALRSFGAVNTSTTSATFVSDFKVPIKRAAN